MCFLEPPRFRVKLPAENDHFQELLLKMIKSFENFEGLEKSETGRASAIALQRSSAVAPQ